MCQGQGALNRLLHSVHSEAVVDTVLDATMSRSYGSISDSRPLMESDKLSSSAYDRIDRAVAASHRDMSIRIAATYILDAMRARSTFHLSIPAGTTSSALDAYAFLSSYLFRRFMIVISWLHLSLILFEPAVSAYGIPIGSPFFLLPFPAVPLLELLFLSMHAFHLFKRHVAQDGSPTSKITVGSILTVCVADTLVALFFPSLARLRVTWLFRPYFFARQSRLLKDCFEVIFVIFKEISSYFVLAATYILSFACVGTVLFSEIDTEQFGNVGSAGWSMLVGLTTSNYPDLMFAADGANRLYVLYFVVFLLIGVFFLLNLVTATVYKAYSGSFQGKLKEKVLRVEAALTEAFAILDAHDRPLVQGGGINADLAPIDDDEKDARKKLKKKTELLEDGCVQYESWLALCHVLRPEMGDDEHKLVWLALDQDGSGTVTLDEFMFLVQYFGVQFHRRTFTFSQETRSKTWFKWAASVQRACASLVDCPVPSRLLSTTFYPFEIVVNAFLVVNLVLLLLETTGNFDFTNNEELFLCLFFVFEMVVRTIAQGAPWSQEKDRDKFDAFVNVVSVFGELWSGAGSDSEATNCFQAIRFFRIARFLVPFRPRMRTFGVTVKTCFPIMGVIFCLLYDYAAMGMYFFSGRVNSDIIPADSAFGGSPGYIEHVNWDDFPRALLTEFGALTMGSWHNVADGGVQVGLSFVPFRSLLSSSISLTLSLHLTLLISFRQPQSGHTFILSLSTRWVWWCC